MGFLVQSGMLVLIYKILYDSAPEYLRDYLFHVESACPVYVDERMLKDPIIILDQKYMNPKVHLFYNAMEHLRKGKIWLRISEAVSNYFVCLLYKQ